MPAQGNSTVATPQFVFAVTKGNIGTAVGWTGQQIAEALADPQLHSHVNMVRAETDPDKQKVLKEEKKYEMLGICPHFFGFRNNHRAAAEALPECCTYETCVDVDDPAYGKQSIEGALRLNQEPGMWRDKVLYIENSLRGGNGEGKCHIWLKQPLGMTAVETQQAFCKALGIPCDDAVQQKQSFILMTGDAVYQSPLWLQPLTQQEIEARQETFHRRGLSIDGWDKLDASKPTTTPTAAPVNTQNTETAVESANERTRYIVGECLKEAGLSVDDLNEEGGRHNTVKAILSVGVTQLLTEGEFLGVMQEMAPAYSQEQEFRQLVSDFYAKYTDASQKMTQFQRRVFAKSRKLCQSPKPAQTAAADHEEPTAVVYGDTAPLADIYSSPQPPRLSNKSKPRFVKTATAPVPTIAKEAAAQAMFPPLGMYCDASFTYIDDTPREPRSNCLIVAGTGGGKDSTTKHMLKHLEAPQKALDGPNRVILEEYKRECNRKSQTKDKPKRPDVAVQSVAADITKARLSELMADSQGRIIHTRMIEFDQWFAVEGWKPGAYCPFTYLKMADDEDNPFGQERVGSQSITYQGPLSINWNASTTPGKAEYYFRNNMTDGPISRLVLATVPDQELGAPIPKHGKYDEKYDASLKPFIDNLRQVHGEILCPQARRMADRLKKELDDFVVKSGSEVLNNLGRRALVAAFRKACLLYAANNLHWEKSIEGFCRFSLHYDLYLKLKFFGDLISKADSQVKTSSRGPRNMLPLIQTDADGVFDYRAAVTMRLQNGKEEDGTRDMLNHWVQRGFIERLDNDKFRIANDK